MDGLGRILVLLILAGLLWGLWDGLSIYRR